MKKWITAIIVIILLAGGGTWYYQKGKAKQVTSTTIIPTATVQKGTLESKVSGSGSLTPATDEDIKIDESKTVDEVLVTENETVKKGEELVTFTDGSDPLVAPANGTISSIAVYDGSRVNAGQVVAHLTNYADLNTVIQVDELDIPDIKVGQAVNITVNAYPNNQYTGKVKSIAEAGSITNGVSTFDVTVHLTNSKSLKAGMTTTAEIITNKKANTLFVPVEAVHKMGNQSYVLVEDSNTSQDQTTSSDQNNAANRRSQWMATGNGNGKRVVVKTGIHNDSDVEIISGLSAGQVVELPAIVKGNNQNQMNSGSQMGAGMFGGNFGGGFNRQQWRSNNGARSKSNSSQRGMNN